MNSSKKHGNVMNKYKWARLFIWIVTYILFFWYLPVDYSNKAEYPWYAQVIVHHIVVIAVFSFLMVIALVLKKTRDLEEKAKERGTI